MTENLMEMIDSGLTEDQALVGAAYAKMTRCRASFLATVKMPSVGARAGPMVAKPRSARHAKRFQNEAPEGEGWEGSGSHKSPRSLVKATSRFTRLGQDSLIWSRFSTLTR